MGRQTFDESPFPSTPSLPSHIVSREHGAGRGFVLAKLGCGNLRGRGFDKRTTRPQK